MSICESMMESGIMHIYRMTANSIAAVGDWYTNHRLSIEIWS